MADNVRPRINTIIYELAKIAASSSGIPVGQWINEAIREKAKENGFKIVDGKIVSSESSISGSTIHQPQNVFAAPEEI